MASEQEFLADEIDIRELINAVLRYKWWIVGVTIVLAVAVFAYSKFMLPKQYEATAYVVITKPSLVANLDARIVSSPQSPDSRSLTTLSKVDDLVYEVYQSPEVSALLEDGTKLSTLKGQMQPSLAGSSQLELVVTDTDPERAAVIANTWAESVVDHLNYLFGVDPASLALLEAQTKEARQEWDAAEQLLLAHLPQNQVNSLQVSLAQARDALKKYLNEIQAIDLLISDAQVLKESLLEQNANSDLLLGDALSLIALQQQATGYLSGMIVQVSDPETLGLQYTVSAALSSLDTLTAALDNQRASFQEEVDAQNAEITFLATELEAAEYELAVLIVDRDLSQKAYQALSSQVEETQITLAQDAQAAMIAGRALPPENPSGPSSILNTAIAGAVGFGLSVFAVLALSWWKSTES